MGKSISQANGDLPAYRSSSINGCEYDGLTKREDIAKHLFAGMLANSHSIETDSGQLASSAVKFTDQLLQALNNLTPTR